jgi:MFS transporter, DHA1 family, tetracycline resistance protein
MPTMARQRKAAIFFIVVTLFIDILGMGIIIPILPGLIREFVGGSESIVACYFGPLSSVYALMQFLCAPLLGALSDRFGRRPVILISLLGLGANYLIMAIAPSIGWLFLGRFVAGIMGASYTTANAYIADISTPENRAQNFGLVGVAFGLGFIFGPAVGGMLGALNIRLPFIAAACFSLMNLLYGFFVLPESLSPENRSHFVWHRANPVSSIMRLRNYPFVASLAMVFILISLPQRGMESIWVLYTSYRFGWGEQANGFSLALVGVMAVIVQGFLIRPVIKALGEERTAILGLGISTLIYVLYGMAYKGWMMLIIVILGTLGGLAGPAIQGLVAGSVSPSDQGKVQGALTSLTSLTSIGAPLIFTTWLFGYFTSDRAPCKLPGAPFFLGALLFLTALIVIMRVLRRISKPADRELESAEVLTL